MSLFQRTIHFRPFLATALFLGLSLALLLPHPALAQVDWKESSSPAPERFSTDKLQLFTVSPRSSMVYGIDPDTLSIGTDGVVRYVMVARSTQGALNVLFEGIRCSTAEVKIYAQWDNRSAWSATREAEWRPLSALGIAHHSVRLARDGVCDGTTINGNHAQILRDLNRDRIGPPD